MKTTLNTKNINCLLNSENDYFVIDWQFKFLMHLSLFVVRGDLMSGLAFTVGTVLAVVITNIFIGGKVGGNNG